MKKIDPLYQLKYVEGFGDLVRVFLHSKYVRPILFLIKGNDEYCFACSQRANALNVLISTPVWKFFFKDQETMRKSFLQDAKNFGHNIVSDADESKREVIPQINEISDNPIGLFDRNQINYDGYEYMQKSECDYDHIRIVTIVFKRNIDNIID
jgi:hypothetical protein